MDLSKFTSKDAQSESIDSTVIVRTLILALLTGLSLELTSLIFKLDKDQGQIIVFPFVLIAYTYYLRNFLPKIIIQALLSTLFLLIFSFLWTQGNFGTRSVSYISKLLISSTNPRLEQLRAEFNRDSEVLNFPKLETIYRNFDDKSAEEWGRGNYRLLVYSDPKNPRLKLFLQDFAEPQTVDFSDLKLQIQLFPEWIPVDPEGIPVDYLTTLTRVLPSLEKQKDKLQILEDLGFAGYAAGLSKGRWNSPAPRAAALLLGASANLAKDNVLGKAELNCIKRDLTAILRKSKLKDSPELRALTLNNLAVTTLLLNFYEQPKKALSISRRLFSEATKIRSFDGKIVNGSRLATANLFALDGSGLSVKSKHHRLSPRSKPLIRQIKRIKKKSRTRSTL